MKLFKKALTVVVMAGMFGGVAQASMINVGGVVFDPDSVNTATTAKDFVARFAFNQYFTTAAQAIPNEVNAAPNYANAIDPTTAGPGNVLEGVGEIFALNGNNVDTTSSTGGGAGSFCPGCELTFTFGGYVINSINSLTNGWLNIYVDRASDFTTTDVVTAGAAAKAANGTLWLSLVANGNKFTNDGSYSSGTLLNYFDVTGGLAQNNFDTNGLSNLVSGGFADLLSSASGTFFPGDRIATSTGQVIGNTIPEPSTVLLFGLALLGLGMTRRQSKRK